MGERAGVADDAGVTGSEDEHAMASKKPNRARISGVKAFFEHEAAGGIVLLAAALLGLILMNSPPAGLYESAARDARAARRARRSCSTSRCCTGSTTA